jgi:FtsH-binding integral membrane protein
MANPPEIEKIVKRNTLLNRLKLVASLCLLASGAMAYRGSYQDFNQALSVIPLILLVFAVGLTIVVFVSSRNQ